MSSGYAQKEAVRKYYGDLHNKITEQSTKAGKAYNLHHGLAFPDGTYNPKDGLQLMASYIENIVDIQPGCRVLDAGCGTGSIALTFADKNPDAQIVALNISDAQLHHAQQIKGQTKAHHEHPFFCLADYSQIPFPPNTFHRAMFVESISHSPNIEQTLADAGRVVDKKGKIVIFDHFALHPPTETDPDVVAFQDLWLAPGIVPIGQVEQILYENFMNFEITPLTRRVLPSVEHLARKRLPQVTDGGMTDGAVLLHDLMRTEKIGYFSIVAIPK